MKTIKTLLSLLLLAAPQICAMQGVISPNDIIKEVEYMDERGTIDMALDRLNVAKSQGQDPLYLHTAVITGKLRALQLFLQADAPIKKDQTGKTPMDHAFAQKNFDAIDILAEFPKARACNLDNIMLQNKDSLIAYCNKKKTSSNYLTTESPIEKILQRVIDNNLLHIPKDIPTSGVNDSVGEFYDKDFTQSCMRLEQVISLASESKIVMPNGLEQAQEMVFLYHLNIHLQSNYHTVGYTRSESALTNFISKHTEYFKSNKSMACKAYAVALHRDSILLRSPLLKTLQDHVAIEPITEWKSAILPSNAEDSQKIRTFLAQVYTTLKLHPHFFIDEKIANAIDDIAAENTYYFSNSLRNLLYDYTSPDRHTFRPVNPWYWYRRCTRARPIDDEATSSASASAVQAEQDDAGQDDDKPIDAGQDNAGHDDNETKKDK